MDVVSMRERFDEARERREWIETVRLLRYLAIGNLPREPIEASTYSRTFRLGRRSPQWCNVFYTARLDGQLPFGQDRIVLALTLEAALRQGSRLVTFESLYAFMRQLGVSDAGLNYRRLRERFRRLTFLSIDIGFGDSREGAEAHNTGEHLQIIRRHAFPEDDEHRRATLEEAGVEILEDELDTRAWYVLFTRDFWDEYANPDHKYLHIPLDIIQHLRDRPLAWDFALFLLYRSSSARRVTRVPHQVLMEHFGAPETDDRTTVRRLKKLLTEFQLLLGDALDATIENAAPLATRGRPRKQWQLVIRPPARKLLNWVPQQR